MDDGSAPWRAGQELAAIWQIGPGETFALSQATQALTIALAILSARGIARPEVWVPAYYCEGGLLPARQTAALRFYPVTDRMTPDWNGVEAMLADGSPHLFVLAHFFGMESEGAAARAFCDRVGSLLHEDCAHVLRPVGTMGAQGDLVSFSPRKYCGIPDAAILVVRGQPLAAEAEVVAGTLNPAVLDTRRESFLNWRNRTLPWLRRTGPLARVDFEADHPDPYSPLRSVWMSSASRARLRRIGGAGLDRIAASEAATVQAIEAAMSRIAGVAPLPRLAGSTPYLLGFSAASPERARRVHDVLRQAGAVAGSWPGLPPEVRAEPHRYGAAMALRRSIVRLTPRFDQRRRPLDFAAALPAGV